MTHELLQKWLDKFGDACDAGPAREGWQSDELLALIEQTRAALSRSPVDSREATEGTLPELHLRPGDIVERLSEHCRYSVRDIGATYSVSEHSGYWRSGLHLVGLSTSGWTTMKDKGRFRVVSRAASAAKDQQP